MESCKHYDDIISSDYMDDDVVTRKLIEYYVMVVKNETDKDRLNKIDNVMYRYIDDYDFCKSLKETVNFDEVFRSKKDLRDMLLNYIVDYSAKYDLNNKTIKSSRWI